MENEKIRKNGNTKHVPNRKIGCTVFASNLGVGVVVSNFGCILCPFLFPISCPIYVTIFSLPPARTLCENKIVTQIGCTFVAIRVGLVMVAS